MNTKTASQTETADTTEYGHKYVLLWVRSAVRDHYAVVAAVNQFDATHGDWAAYLGNIGPTHSPEAIETVARYGAKLSETEARAFARGRFDLDKIAYRS